MFPAMPRGGVRKGDQKSVGVICSTSRSLWRISELSLNPVNVLTPTVKVETKTTPRSAVVKNRAIGSLPLREPYGVVAWVSVTEINKF
jgi:hypothetical protein